MKVLLIVLPLLLFGCKSDNPVVCAAAKTAAAEVTTVVGQVCTCSKPAALTAQTLKSLGAIGICPSGEKLAGPLGAVVCGPVISLLLSKGCSQLPAEANCTGNADSSALQAAIALCQSKI